MNQESNGLILHYKCQNEGCSQFDLPKNLKIGYIICELIRYCSDLKCSDCGSGLEVDCMELINSNLKLSGIKELKREPFNLSLNKKESTFIKLNLDFYAYADISVCPYDENSSYQELINEDYLRFCKDNSKIVFFQSLTKKKALKLHFDKKISLINFSKQLKLEFSSKFYLCNFYYNGKRIFDLEETFETNKDSCIQIINTNEIKKKIILIIINNGLSTESYKIAFDDSLLFVTVYDALFLLRCTYDLGSIFRGTFTIKDSLNNILNFEDQIDRIILLDTYFPENVINLSLFYQNKIIDSFSFEEGTKFDLIKAQCSIFISRDKKYLDFYFNGDKVTENFEVVPSIEEPDFNIYMTENDSYSQMVKYIDLTGSVYLTTKIYPENLKSQELFDGINFELHCLMQDCPTKKIIFSAGFGISRLLGYTQPCPCCKTEMKLLNVWILNCCFWFYYRRDINEDFIKKESGFYKDIWGKFIISDLEREWCQVEVEAIEINK